MRGVLVDAEGAPFPAPELKLFDLGASALAALAVDPASGRFEQAVLPGRFLLACVVERRGFSLGEHQLAAGQVLDLGQVRAPRTGRLHLLPGAGSAPETAPARYRISVQYSDASVFRELRRGTWPPPEELELFAGRHWLEARDETGALIFRGSADVPAGGDTWMDLP